MCDGWQEGDWMDRTGSRYSLTGQMNKDDPKSGNEIHKIFTANSRDFAKTWGAGKWMDQMGRREFNETWAQGNWMRRLGMDPSVFDPQGGSSDSSSVADISTIFDQSTGGLGGKNRKAKIASNKGTSVGKKKLTIKPSYA